ncbi:hypothetical protein [Mucilaginibacter sp. SP1R1]|uniref:hypothetical protein n=1 Tax=Mucilaginibacter sp. SP1R1 TaxID=2723091 RepID=UPI0016146772|nr:hypothetical protein [Mucilaginibacter sp. SP1R1]MBB6149475.1 hypothetical protein [Mucilaginibacter sp. SP1R1]
MEEETKDHYTLCNGCGIGMAENEVRYTTEDGFDYCNDCNDAIQSDDESSGRLDREAETGSVEYKSENFDTIDGAWDWHSRAIPETVYSPEELEYLMGEQIMFKRDFEESADSLIKRQAISFLDWINNNWFIPTEDSYWKLDTKNIEYQRTIPPKDSEIFDADALFQMFLNGEGEI